MKNSEVETIVEMLCDTSNEFRQLYNGNIKGYASHAEADVAFCELIAPMCHYDTEVMDKIYRSSGLMRPKWDREQQGSTYGKIILKKAMKLMTNDSCTSSKND